MPHRTKANLNEACQIQNDKDKKKRRRKKNKTNHISWMYLWQNYIDWLVCLVFHRSFGRWTGQKLMRGVEGRDWGGGAFRIIVELAVADYIPTEIECYITNGQNRWKCRHKSRLGVLKSEVLSIKCIFIYMQIKKLFEIRRRRSRGKKNNTKNASRGTRKKLSERHKDTLLYAYMCVFVCNVCTLAWLHVCVCVCVCVCFVAIVCFVSFITYTH